MTLVLEPKRLRSCVLRLLIVLALLGCPQIGSATGTWSVISLPQKSGEVNTPNALAVDAVGNLYVADSPAPSYLGRIQRRDAQGHWSLVAAAGAALGQAHYPTALAVDTAGNLYVADQPASSSYVRIQKRDAQGNWSDISPGIWAPITSLAVDTAGNLYVGVEYGGGGSIHKRDAQGIWSVIASEDPAFGVGPTGPSQLFNPRALAVDTAGNLYLGGKSIQKRDAQGSWSIVATQYASALAVDTAGSIYVAGNGIQKWDAQGIWSVIATAGSDLGQVESQYYGGPFGLAVDGAGNLYVADTGNNRVQMYTPGP